MLQQDVDYLDPKQPAAQRTEALLALMTLEEKVGQMCQYVGETSEGRAENADEVTGYSLALGDKIELVRSGRVGSFLKVPGALEANYLQEQAAASRLKIPLLIGTDAKNLRIVVGSLDYACGPTSVKLLPQRRCSSSWD